MVMRYEEIKGISNENFRRCTGVVKPVFEKMLEVLEVAHEHKKRFGGRPSKNSVGDMLMMTLMYLREYRTYLHIGQTYGVSESNAYQSIRWAEDTLIKSGEFKLPGKKSLGISDMEFEFFVIDATESPIERPKKTKNATIRAKSGDTH